MATAGRWLTRTLTILWLICTLVLVIGGAWSATHIETVTATVTSHTVDAVGNHVCSLTWSDPAALGEPHSADGLVCDPYNELGSDATVYRARFWEKIWKPYPQWMNRADDLSQPLAVVYSALWGPLLTSIVLAVAITGLGVLLATLCYPIVEHLDRRRMERKAQIAPNSVKRLPPAGVMTDSHECERLVDGHDSSICFRCRSPKNPRRVQV